MLLGRAFRYNTIPTVFNLLTLYIYYHLPKRFLLAWSISITEGLIKSHFFPLQPSKILMSTVSSQVGCSSLSYILSFQSLVSLSSNE